MTKDPVCLMDIQEEKAIATSIYKGKTYYFCSHICKDRFDKEFDKETFIKRLEEPKNREVDESH